MKFQLLTVLFLACAFVHGKVLVHPEDETLNPLVVCGSEIVDLLADQGAEVSVSETQTKRRLYTYWFIGSCGWCDDGYCNPFEAAANAGYRHLQAEHSNELADSRDAEISVSETHTNRRLYTYWFIGSCGWCDDGYCNPFEAAANEGYRHLRAESDCSESIREIEETLQFLSSTSDGLCKVALESKMTYECA